MTEEGNTRLLSVYLNRFGSDTYGRVSKVRTKFGVEETHWSITGQFGRSGKQVREILPSLSEIVEGWTQLPSRTIEEIYGDLKEVKYSLFFGKFFTAWTETCSCGNPLPDTKALRLIRFIYVTLIVILLEKSGNFPYRFNFYRLPEKYQTVKRGSSLNDNRKGCPKVWFK